MFYRNLVPYTKCAFPSVSLHKNLLSDLSLWIIQRNSMFENPLMYIFHFNSSESDAYFYHPHVYQYIYHPYFVYKWYCRKILFCSIMLLLLKRKCHNHFFGGEILCVLKSFRRILFLRFEQRMLLERTNKEQDIV